MPYRNLREFYETERHYATHTSEDWVRFRLYAASIPFAGACVLDVGAAEGEFLAQARSSGAIQAIAFDLGLGKLQRGRVRFGHSGVQGSGDTLPFRDGTFDLISSFETLEHMERPAQAVREMYRVCKEGGTLAISLPGLRHHGGGCDSMEAILRGEEKHFAHLHLFSFADACGLLSGCEGAWRRRDGVLSAQPILHHLGRLLRLNLPRLVARVFPSLGQHVYLEFRKLTREAPSILRRTVDRGAALFFARGTGFRLHPGYRPRHTIQAQRAEVLRGLVMREISAFPGSALVVEDFPWWSALAGHRGWRAFLEAAGRPVRTCAPADLGARLRSDPPRILVLSGEAWPDHPASLALGGATQAAIAEFAYEGGLVVADRFILHRASGSRELARLFGVRLAASSLPIADESLYVDAGFGLRLRSREEVAVPTLAAADVEILSRVVP